MTPNDLFANALTGADPPEDWPGPLKGLWHAARGNWDTAHRIVQADPSAEAAWVHAHLHRIEGDLANARYWYGVAGRVYTPEPIADEQVAIAADLIASAAGSLDRA